MLAYLFSLYGADRFATPRILKAAAAAAALATLSAAATAALPLLCSAACTCCIIQAIRFTTTQNA